MIIINKDPEKDCSLIGAKVVEILVKYGNEKIDPMLVYQELKSNTKITYELFMFALCWLFLIDVIEASEDGYIVKCF